MRGRMRRWRPIELIKVVGRERWRREIVRVLRRRKRRRERRRKTTETGRWWRRRRTIETPQSSVKILLVLLLCTEELHNDGVILLDGFIEAQGLFPDALEGVLQGGEFDLGGLGLLQASSEPDGRGLAIDTIDNKLEGLAHGLLILGNA